MALASASQVLANVSMFLTFKSRVSESEFLQVFLLGLRADDLLVHDVEPFRPE